MKLINADTNPTQTHSLPPSHSSGKTWILLWQLSQLLVRSSKKLWDCQESANNWEVLGRVTYDCECACKEVAMSPCEVCIWTEKLYVLHYFRRIGITEDSGNQSRKREIQIKTRWLLHSVKLAQEGVNYTRSCTTEASWAVSSIHPLGTQVVIPPLSPAGFIFKEALHSTSNSVSGSPAEATKGR